MEKPRKIEELQPRCTIGENSGGGEIKTSQGTETSREATFTKIGTQAALASLTPACGGGSSTSSQGNHAATNEPTQVDQLSEAQAASFILKADLSVSKSKIASVRSKGYEAWLEEEIALPIEETAQQFFQANGYDVVDANRHFSQPLLMDQMIWSQLLSGGNGVRKRIALALSEFFTVSINDFQIYWPAQAIGAYWDLLNKRAFGNFRDLIEHVALSPAMGTFLNTSSNRKEDPTSRRQPDENFARELMQLFSIGLLELNMDGSVRVSGGVQQETYSNDDVTGLAKVFTGYEIDHSGLQTTPHPDNLSVEVPDIRSVSRPMTSDGSKWLVATSEDYHSTSEKRFLSATIGTDTNAASSLKMALDELFAHSNVGPFFAKQMIQRLVTSNPSPGYVSRISQVFNDNGAGVRGDLRAVFKAILLDEEAANPARLSDPRVGKLREPMLRFAHWGRTFGARSASGKWRIRDVSGPELLGQVPFRAPSVFGFFRPEFSPPASQAIANGLAAPEFQIVNETTVAGYVNFMTYSMNGTGHWFEDDDVAADYAYELPLAHEADLLVDHLDLLLTAKQLRPGTRATIRQALADIPVSQASPIEDKLRRIHVAVTLIMASTDYLVQK